MQTELSVWPQVQAQGIADHHERGSGHTERRDQGGHQTEHGQRHGEQVIAEGEPEVLLVTEGVEKSLEGLDRA